MKRYQVTISNAAKHSEKRVVWAINAFAAIRTAYVFFGRKQPDDVVAVVVLP